MWHANCIDKKLTCSGGDLGNGLQMKQFASFSWTASSTAGPGTVMRLRLLALAVGLAWAGAAQADVIEIGANGKLRTLSDAPDATWTSDDTQQATAAEPSLAVFPDGAVTVVDGRISGNYAQALQDIARANDISPHLLEALVWQESRWNQAAVSRAGAIGLAQLMPGTARDLGVDPRDPIQKSLGGCTLPAPTVEPLQRRR